MEKTRKYARNGLTMGTMLEALGNTLDKSSGCIGSPTQHSVEASCRRKQAKEPFRVGLIGMGIGAISDYQNSLEVPAQNRCHPTQFNSIFNHIS